MMKKLILTFLFNLLCIVSFGQEARVQVIEPAVYKQKVTADSIQFIDIRTPEEYAAGHIEGAKNIDFLAEGFLPKMNKFDKNESVYIYCRTGNRTAKAAEQLSEIGFRNIIDLKGGYKAWIEIEEED